MVELIHYHFMPLESVHDIIRKAEINYLAGVTNLGKYVSWSMHDTIETIDAYLNSKHTSGSEDSLGREKPFFNIVTAAVNIWYRATDIDRKDIKFVPTNNESIVLAFVANVMLQNWMDKYRFGQFLNSWGRALARYGSSVAKFVEQGDELVPSIIPWNRYIADPVQFDALPRIEKFYLTPAQLRRKKDFDQDVVSRLIDTQESRRTLDKLQKDTMNDFIELYEVHGELDSRLLEDEPDLNTEAKNIKYRQQMHVVSYCAKEGQAGEYEDFTLYKGKENKDPYLKTDLIEEDGRTLAIGAVEYLFDAQWMQNHTVKNMKDTLDLSSKLIFQTSDSNFVGRNVLSAIETGDILIHKMNEPVVQFNNTKQDVAALQNFGMMWQNMAREITATPDAMRGTVAPSATFGSTALEAKQANSLFELMTENKGLAIEEMMRSYVIPHLKKQLAHKDQVVAILDAAGIQEIDSLYIPQEAIKRENQRVLDTMTMNPPGSPQGIPSPLNPQGQAQDMQSQMGALGNKRFFKPDELGTQTWADLFSDFEWDSVRVEVTNEAIDKQVVLQTLNTVLQTVASNPMILSNPNAMAIFSAILRETGSISPIQLTSQSSLPPPRPTIRVTEGIDYKDLPPEAQQQMLAGVGIQVQPQPQPQQVPGAPGGGGALPAK